ncbi:MAG: isochorismatase family protein [Saprospiraceae bacterium]|nr:isochorismatase family protein [Saprospiraceae bacterium]
MKALLLLGFQIDFLPGGSLSIPDSGRAVPLANTYMPLFSEVVLCLDQHPADHSSFAANHLWRRPGQTIPIADQPRLLWDMHCVKGSFGAEIAPGLDTERITFTCQKGTDPSGESYSAFWNSEHQEPSGLSEYLSAQSISGLYLMGMPLEYEILHTALDALQLGLKTIVLRDACFPLQPEQQSETLRQLEAAGATIILTKALNPA